LAPPLGEKLGDREVLFRSVPRGAASMMHDRP
jgi:hypothetical protein